MPGACGARCRAWRGARTASRPRRRCGRSPRSTARRCASGTSTPTCSSRSPAGRRSPPTSPPGSRRRRDEHTPMRRPAAPPHVVIVGGGFGGLYAARALARRAVRVTLLDRRNHHLFQPLLYQVATAALNPSDIAVPLRSVLRKATNITVLLAEAARADLPRRPLLLHRGEIGYDALVLAARASHPYFAHDDWEVLAPGLKTLERALEIRRRLLLAYQAAERESDGAERQALLTFVVIGGGPTRLAPARALP